MMDLQQHRGQAAWLGSSMAEQNGWIHSFTASEIRELQTAAHVVLGQDLATLNAADFSLPELDPI